MRISQSRRGLGPGLPLAEAYQALVVEGKSAVFAPARVCGRQCPWMGKKTQRGNERAEVLCRPFGFEEMFFISQS